MEPTFLVRLFGLINREWTNGTLDWVMGIFSSFDLWRWPLVILILLVAWRGGCRARMLLVSLVLILSLGEGVVIRTLKSIVDRPRPHQAMAGVRIVEMRTAKGAKGHGFPQPRVKDSTVAAGDVAGRSFPSGHTTNTFCVATILTCIYRWRGALTFVPATLVAYSRIYTGSHWVSDVLGSMLLGIALALVGLRLLAWAWRRWGGRCWPGLHARHPGWLNASTV